MKICMTLLDADFPTDIRIEKEARSLVTAGHEITIVCSHKIQSRPMEDRWESCRVIRLPRDSFLVRGTMQLATEALHFNPKWFRQLNNISKIYRFDAFHVHDLPLLGTVLKLARQINVPVVADFHENYPAALKFYLEGDRWQLKIRRLFYRRDDWENYETRSCQEARRIITVVDEAKERLILKGIPSDKIFVVENMEDVDYFSNLPIFDDVVEGHSNNFVISYIGGFGGTHRGLPTVISAMPEILRTIPNAHLLLVGDGPIKPTLESMVRNLALENNVSFVEWQPFERVPSYISCSNVCLVPHDANPHTEATSPHKLYQYQLMKKPVVVSSCKPLKRAIEQTGGGTVFETGSSQDLARAVIALKDKDKRDAIGKSGYEAVCNKYNWGETAKILVSMYEDLANMNGPSN